MKNYKFIPMILILCLMITFIIPFGNNASVEANPALLVSKGAQKLLGSIAVKGGVKGTQKGVQSSVKTVVKKDGGLGKPDLGKPIMPPQQWIMESKKAPTKKTHGGKFLKYTLAGSSFLGMATLLSGSVAEMEPDQDGNILMNYDDYYTPESVSGIDVTLTTDFNIRRGGTGNRTTYVDYKKLSSNTWDTASTTYGRINDTFGQLLGFTLNPNSSSSILMSHAVYHNADGSFRRFETTTLGIKAEDFFLDVNNLVEGEYYTYLEKIPQNEIYADPVPEEEIMPDKNAENVEIYVPNNDDAIEQVMQNPDILFNPDIYVNVIPEGDPNVTEDAVGQPLEEVPGEGTGTPGAGGEPEIDGKLNLEPLKQLGSDFTKVFPFSLPWDIKRGIDSLMSEKEAPTFTIAIPLPGELVKHEISLPDSFIAFVPLVRAGFVAVFIIGLIYGTRSLMGGSV